MIFTGGLPETACGVGSTLRYTEHLRAELPVLLKRLRIMSLMDAPCGDFNWLAATDLRFLAYIGGDIDEANLATARTKALSADMPPIAWSFVRVDLTLETPPKTDLMFCRDFLQHLPNKTVRAVLRGFVWSGTPWLLTTSHTAETNIDISELGGFRPLDLTKPPFSFPSPVMSIEDGPGSGRVLGLWDREFVAAYFSAL